MMRSFQDSNRLACSPSTTPDFYLGDEWYVQPSLYRIRRAGEDLRVGPKVMHVLICLAQTPGQVVSRDTLMDTVWPETHVVEESLSRCISELRKMFGDDPKQPRVIETIRNVGYRLLAPVSNTQPATAYSGDALPPGTPALDAAIRPPLPKASWSSQTSVRWAGLLILLLAGGLVGRHLWKPAPATVIPLQPVPLTSYPGEERGAALSPDGEHLAFTWGGDTGQNIDVYVKLVGAETPLRLTDDPALDVSPAWSPDGHHVAFMRYKPPRGCVILVVSALGGVERNVGSCGHNRSADLAWSPDGAWLAYSDRPTPDSPSHIVLISSTTREQRPLTTPPDSLNGDYDPSFSPDGHHLAFTRRASGEAYDLYLVPLEQGLEKRLTFDNRLIRGHTWTPDGRRIVFASNRAGTFSLWQVPATGGTPDWIAATGMEQARHPSTARRSQRLVFERSMNEVNIWRLDVRTSLHDTARARPLLVSTRMDVMPHFSPDSHRLVFISNRSGFFELWAADQEGTNLTPLTSLEGAVNGDPRWSPDGTRIAFSSLRKQQSDIVVLEVETGTLRQITSSSSDDWVPRWSHDGRWIYFTSNRNGSWQIWKIAADGGEAIQMTQQGGRAASESLDGRFLYVARSDTAGIWRLPIEGGAATLVLGQTHASDWGSWAVVEDGLYFIDRRALHPGISFFRFDTGVVTTEAALPLASTRNITRGIPSLTVSLDRKQFVFAQFDRKERDIMMVEGF